MMVWCAETTRVTELNRAAGFMEVDAFNSGTSCAAYDTKHGTRSFPRSLFRAIGFGLGIAGLCVVALTLVLEPVLVVEPNLWIRVGELFWICVGVAALVIELFWAGRQS